MFAISAAQQFSCCGYVQGDITLQLDGADEKGSGWNQHGTAAITIAGVDRCLQPAGIERHSIAFGAVAANVVDARAKAAGDFVSFAGIGRQSLFTGQAGCDEG